MAILALAMIFSSLKTLFREKLFYQTEETALTPPTTINREILKEQEAPIGETEYPFDKEESAAAKWTSPGPKETIWIQDGGRWILLNDKYYYLREDGTMHTGWLIDQEQYYFLDAEGVMRTGWIIDQNKAYYLDAKGIYQPNKKIASAGAAVALTFDDGPGEYTGHLLDTLERNEAKATFFVLGELTEQYPEALKKMRLLGCQIGNHSYDHTLFTRLDEVTRKAQMKDTADKVKQITGSGLNLVRPPGGGYNEEVLESIFAPVILWSIDPRDWESKNTVAVGEMILNNVEDGDVILLHDIYQTTVDAADIIIPALKDMGYDLVTVDKLAEINNVKLEKHKVYHGFK